MTPEKLDYQRLFVLLSFLFISGLVMLAVNPALLKKGGVNKNKIETRQPRELAALLTFDPGPEINAQAYIVKIIGVDRPLLSQREWKRLAPASLTKILTAVLAKEMLSSDEKITFSEEAKKTEEKLSPLKANEEVTRDKAIELALVNSFNDAALALAESIGKSRASLASSSGARLSRGTGRPGGTNFAERLAIFKTLANEKANLLGLQNSAFKNPIGLDEDGHYSTAQDLAQLAEYVWLHHADLWIISRQAETVTKIENGLEYRIENTNELLKEFPAILGSKTGFIDKARGALLFLYPVRPNKVAVVVILNSEDRFGDGRKIIQWLEKTSTNKK